jgi:hypothetical protein
MDIREMECEGVNWIRLAEGKIKGAFVNAVLNLR